MTLSLNKCQIQSDSMEEIVTKIQIKNKSEPLLDKNKEIFHINQSVRYTVIFNSQCTEFFLWLEFKFTEKTTNHKQNQVEPSIALLP